MKYEHEVIRDLMPLCIDDIASPQSLKAVERHIAECPDCAKEWNNMKNRIQAYDNTPLPEDTQKYVKTAKRIRKHNRWVMLKVTCGVIAAMLIILSIGNYIGGARFTARNAAEHYLRSFGMGNFFASPEEYHNAEKPKLTYIGKAVSEDEKTNIVYELLETKDGSIRTMCICNVFRQSELTSLGMWQGMGMNAFAVSDKNSPAVYLNISGGSYENGQERFAAVYSTDERVSTVEIIAYGNPVTLTLDSNGFGAVPIVSNFDWESEFGEAYSVREGKAMDASGQVLYKLEKVVEDQGTSYKLISSE